MSSTTRAITRLGALSVMVIGCSTGAKDAARDSAGAGATAAAAATRTDSASGAAASTSSASQSASQSSAMLDPNAATREQLVVVQGMTPAAADALIAGRPYTDMVAVNAVLAKHIDDAGRKTVYAKVWKPIDLNTAKGEEILLIPGVGPRMRHEFEEYRPYKNIEQFRREIGKYVDKNEVARLEQYVTIR